MSNTLEAYRHSGKFKFSAVALCLGSAAALGFPLGLAYAFFIGWVPFIYFNMLATVAYGLAFGWLAIKTLKSGQVSHDGLAAGCGLAAGLLALYFEWSGHVHMLYKDAPWFLWPDQILGAMSSLYEHGSWGMHKGENFTGIPLALVWVAEAGLIVGLAAWLPYAFVKDTPFCEKTRCWLDENKKIDALEAGLLVPRGMRIEAATRGLTCRP
ncbi:MAG: hypothetical protein EXS42_05505 [Lacunisphaera sp.]|nr:hypothetical protein [Lacunisphaera sp.]